MALCPKPYNLKKDIQSATPQLIASNNNNNKRGCNFLYPSATNKKICLQQFKQQQQQQQQQQDVSAAAATATATATGSASSAPFQLTSNNNRLSLPKNYYSSSSSDDDSEDEQSCYNADQVRAHRRASSRVLFTVDSRLSRAISQYSDGEDNRNDNSYDDDDDDFYDKEKKNRRERFFQSRRTSDSSIKILKSDHEIANLDCKLVSSPISSSISLKKMFGDSGSRSRIMTDGCEGKNKEEDCRDNDDDNDDDDNEEQEEGDLSHAVAVADKNARVRCFDYLIGAIDEAWARYCDATTYVEDEVHGYITPASLASDGDDDDKELMNLKQRLVRSKDFLQDHIESHDINDVRKFWHRWDISKYQMLDVMEDDDDVLDELESGRRIF
ncbi:hypothetical protein KGF56_001241 [Candida oxycetoniae]|uniref:Uncharacterized protein n=1 Tax=Candida oxycetoniae TaxID=497107 RepID=A0AAI9WZ55_9ASCO|nr:uncharacterized protein KGF56_001241 [Candida oxycetoniae]KAI3406022.1 hypothetical protein KGF56_001241 [Candida oxycetoniae]